MKMKNHLRLLKWVAALLFPFWSYGQIINTTAASQGCQCDTITVSFSVGATPLNSGNQFFVEISNNSGVFSGNFIQITPLIAFNTGSYQIPSIIPCNLPQGAYSIRVVGNNPSQTGNVVDNIIIGKLPPADQGFAIENGYFSAAFNDWRFCDGDTVILRAPAPNPGESFTYRWFENGVLIPGQSGAGVDTLLVTESGTFGLRLTLGLCEAFTEDVLINKYLPPTTIVGAPGPGIIVTPDSIRFCDGTIGILNGPNAIPGVTYSYQWLSDSLNLLGQTVLYPLVGDTLRTLSVDSNMRVYLVVNDGFCVDTSDLFNVVVDEIPLTNILPFPWPGRPSASLSICENDSVLLGASNPSSLWDYQWQFFTVGSWVDIPNEDSSFISVSTNLIPDTTQFRLRITNGQCIFFSDTLRVNIVPLPDLSFNVSEDTIRLCPGDSMLLVAQGANSYTWSTQQTGPAIWVSQPGTYSVTGRGPNACESTIRIVAIFFNPVANAGADITTFPDTTVQLNGSGGSSYFWSANKPVFFSNQFIANPFTIASNKPDTVTYYLEIVGPNGCTDRDSMLVIVQPLPEDIFPHEIADRVPNLITPNGDGYNDFLDLSEVIGEDVCGIAIINRWGATVFDVETYQNNWQGTDNGGADLPDGAYFLILDCDGVVKYKGSVTILRNVQ
jgi:gliding motility-associated-like protein